MLSPKVFVCRSKLLSSSSRFTRGEFPQPRQALGPEPRASPVLAHGGLGGGARLCD